MAGVVVVHKSVSLDGYVAGPRVSIAEPMGEGGERLHRWLFEQASEADTEVAAAMFAEVGAVVLGRRTFEVGRPQWEDTPYPVPCFVLTHTPRPPVSEKRGAFTFVTDGPASAVAHARAAAGGKSVIVMGAETSQALLAAGLVDEIQLNLVPVLLGDGVRLFGDLPGRIDLELLSVVGTDAATHVRFRVRSPAAASTPYDAASR
jgi:dihydrofolate reductase